MLGSGIGSGETVVQDVDGIHPIRCKIYKEGPLVPLLCVMESEGFLGKLDW